MKHMFATIIALSLLSGCRSNKEAAACDHIATATQAASADSVVAAVRTNATSQLRGQITEVAFYPPDTSGRIAVRHIRTVTAARADANSARAGIAAMRKDSAREVASAVRSQQTKSERSNNSGFRFWSVIALLLLIFILIKKKS